MKKIFLKFIVFVLCFAFVFSGAFATSAYAAESVQPRLNNFNRASYVFSVTSPQTAEVAVTYSAKADVFTQAKVTVEVQKQVLWLFWVTVDIGEPNNKWVAYSTDVYGTFNHVFSIDGAGTYRAIIKLEVSGTGGATDVVEEIIESTY